MTIYAVTGASGHLGRFAVQELLACGVAPGDVVAFARTPGKVADLAARGVQVRQADYARPQTLRAALADVERLLLVSGSEAGLRLAHHANVIDAAKTAGVSRIAYTSMLNADTSSSPLAGEHRDTEQALRQSTIAFSALRNGWYIENYTEQLSQYLAAGEILGATGDGKLSAATRQDYAIAAARALLYDDGGNRTYELGGPAFDLTQLAKVVTDVTGTQVIYRDMSEQQYADALQRAGLDDGTARYVAALDASIARGDLETGSHDLGQLLGRPATTLAEVVGAAAVAVPS